MKKCSVSVRAEVDLEIEAKSENKSYELALEELYRNPDKIISDVDMDASEVEEDN